MIKMSQPETNPDCITLSDLQGLFESGIPFTLIDVREPHEWASGHLEGAQHIPLGQLLTAPEAGTTQSVRAHGRLLPAWHTQHERRSIPT